ncbi:hypothetical protein NGM36_18055 [Streptomyces mutabilis]|uniref:hypothetical protein n=1 Tax=Streptomyces mutabilis TaxID=67332 RepID=UPI0022BA2DCF|nr:hypothetical protein [Streptomyces mutabilis]MCZ9351663.1 hypothetical protein [Streptomyces mutabilis]
MGTTSAVRHSAGSGPGEDRDGGGGRFGRIVRSPLGWMLAGMVGVGLVPGLTATGPGPVPVLGAIAAVAVYCCVMRRVARRSTPEIARSGAGREVLLGGGIGLGFVLVHGGDFGLETETSVVPVLIGVALAVSMLVLAHRNGGIKTRRRASH